MFKSPPENLLSKSVCLTRYETDGFVHQVASYSFNTDWNKLSTKGYKQANLTKSQCLWVVILCAVMFCNRNVHRR